MTTHRSALRKKLTGLLLAAGLVALSGAPAHALSITIDDKLDFGPDCCGLYVDFFGISAAAPTHFMADVTAHGLDLLGNGVADLRDAELYLLRDDGSRSADDIVAHNDDYSALGSGGESGSIHRYDSFLSVNLAPGDYLLAVGQFSFSEDELIAGIMDTGINFHEYMERDQTFSTNYRLTLTFDTLDGPGNGSQIPEPGTVLLLGTGMAGLALWARRREQKEMT